MSREVLRCSAAPVAVRCGGTEFGLWMMTIEFKAGPSITIRRTPPRSPGRGNGR